jgi:hypothetical protein
MKIRAAPVTDQFRHEDECVVLVDHMVVHLSALPTAILELAADWIELAALGLELERRFGPAPDGTETAMERAVLELHEQGLVERG